MFTVKGSNVLYTLVSLTVRNGRIYVTGSACNGIFTVETDLDNVTAYGVEE